MLKKIRQHWITFISFSLHLQTRFRRLYDIYSISYKLLKLIKSWVCKRFRLLYRNKNNRSSFIVKERERKFVSRARQRRNRTARDLYWFPGVAVTQHLWWPRESASPGRFNMLPAEGIREAPDQSQNDHRLQLRFLPIRRLFCNLRTRHRERTGTRRTVR